MMIWFLRPVPRPATGLSCQFDVGEEELTVRLTGRAGSEQVPALVRCLRALRSQRRPRVVLDLARLEAVAPSAAAALASFADWVVGAGGRFRVVNVAPPVRAAFAALRGANPGGPRARLYRAAGNPSRN
jgi:anti-anti-sigma regulatory factor